jgi:prepilin-type N-terminal cleavage/methylation domain-containing protein
MKPASPRGLSTERPGQAGFTLLEVAVVALLLSLVAAGVMPLLVTGDQAYQEAWRRQEMLRNARVALDQIGREFQRASAVLQASGGVLRLQVVAEAGEETVEFVLQPDGDLTYRLGAGPPQPLAGPFSGFQLRCFDAAGSEVLCSTPASVRQVEVQLDAADPEPDPVRGALPALHVTARVARRVP